jgi:hypothetical protein
LAPTGTIVAQNRLLAARKNGAKNLVCNIGARC